MLFTGASFGFLKLKEKQIPSEVTACEPHFGPGRFAAFLAICLFATFAGVLLGKQTFVFRDSGLFSYPVAAFQRECFWRGEVPLWNPLNYCGVPFLAQWNTMTLYPPSLFYMFFPLSWSLPVFCIAHLFWGGLGMYFLARSFTRDSVAAALAGVIFAFNGLTLSLLMWQSHEATFSWVPWVLWLGQRAWREGGKSLAWGAIAGSMQMLAGGPETILFTWVILCSLAAGDLLQKAAPPTRLVCRFAGMAIQVALICAAQLLPFLQLLAHSQRDSGFGSSAWSMPIWGWANLLVPLFHTAPSPQGVYLQDGQYLLSSYYIGIGTVLLIVMAARYATEWRARIVVGLLLIALVLALGDRGLLYRALRSCVPAIGFARYPVKFVILFAALAPLAAAVGFDALAKKQTRSRRFEWGCAMLLLLLMAVILLFEPKSSEQTSGLIGLNALERAAVLAVSLLLMEFYWRSKARPQLLCGALLIMVCWLDFLTHMPPQNPTVSPEVFSQAWIAGGRNWKSAPTPGVDRAMVARAPEEALEFHSMKTLEETFLMHRLGLFSNCNLIDQVPKINGFFSLTPSEINLVTYLINYQTNIDFSPLIDFMGVSQLLDDAETLGWHARPTAMPLVTAGQQPVFADDPAALNGFTGTNDLRKVVFLSSDATNEISATAEKAASVSAIQFRNQSVSFRVVTPSPTMAVISQTYYPAWKAFVDDQPVKLWRANYAFQAVQVPPGEHTVTLRYQDRAFFAGVCLSGFGCLLCFAVWNFGHLPSTGVANRPITLQRSAARIRQEPQLDAAEQSFGYENCS